MSVFVNQGSATISLSTEDPYKACELLINVFRSLEDNSRCSVLFPVRQQELIVYKHCGSVESRLEYSNRVYARFPEPLQSMYESSQCKVYKVILL